MNIHTIDYEGAQDLKLVFESLKELRDHANLDCTQVNLALKRIDTRIKEIVKFEEDMKLVLSKRPEAEKLVVTEQWTDEYQEEETVTDPRILRRVYMTTCNDAGFVYVKDLDFFTTQGGFREEWGLGWKPVVAVTIEEARKEGCKVHPKAVPYEEQTNPKLTHLSSRKRET